jgi:hypothetical protein
VFIIVPGIVLIDDIGRNVGVNDVKPGRGGLSFDADVPGQIKGENLCRWWAQPHVRPSGLLAGALFDPNQTLVGCAIDAITVNSRAA